MSGDSHIVNALGEIRAAADNAQRTDVKIVAVTKTFGVDAIIDAMDAGLTAVGENYAQELTTKFDELTASGHAQPEWHFIGQLQRKKVRKLAHIVDVWQTVDSLPLAEEIAKHAPGARTFLQLNLTDDEGRGGVSSGDVSELLDKARNLGLDVRGLMAVAPIGDDDSTRQAFREVSALNAELGLAELSIGMSGDYRIALEEGATLLRIGSALFGARPQRQTSAD